MTVFMGILSYLKPMKVSQSLLLVLIAAGMSAVIAKLRAYAKRVIPVGYQDESGFHIGVEE
jgi:di/tricarboxylate transporter